MQKRTNKKKLNKSSGVVTKTGTSEHLERDKAVIDEYFNNGYNKTKAIETVFGRSFKYASQPVAMFNGISEKPYVKKYIEQKQLGLRAETNVAIEQVLKERINQAYSDITDYIGKTEEELKALRPEQRRLIQSYETTEREETDRKGHKVVTRTTKVKLVDKSEALKEVSKHIGFYEADNKQKAPTLDLSKASPDQLNTLLSLINSQKKDQEGTTIDI